MLRTCFIAFLILTGVCTVVPTSALSQVRQVDSLALVSLYHRLEGPGWFNQENWLSGPVRTWAGVGVRGDRVDSLNLSFNNLTGSFPPSIYDIEKLRVFSLGGNHIDGVLSEDLGKLINLEYFLVFGNDMTGRIPPEIAKLKKLKLLALAANKFFGELPPEIGQLENLENLDLFGNNFSGQIPIELTRLSKLSRLFLTTNEFSGPIPPELGLLANLEVVRIERNAFTGELPIEFANLEKLRILDLSDNQLSGDLPAEWSLLKNLQVLWLYDNQLTGSIPDTWSNLESLITFQILNNPLSGTLPSSLSQLNALTHLNIRNTNICVPLDTAFQVWLDDLSSFLSSGIECVATSQLHETVLPTSLHIDAAYPNPAINRVTFKLGLPATSPLTLTIYDMQGRLRRHVDLGIRHAGWHSIDTEVSNLAPGVYIVELQSETAKRTQPILVIN